MRLWQKGMIYLARNKSIKSFMQNRASVSNLAKKFVGGKNVNEVVQKCYELRSDKIRTSLFYLGEYEKELSVINQTVDELIELIKGLVNTDIDIFISVDPTQIGLQLNKETSQNNALKIANEIKQAIEFADRETKNFLMIDMEDSTVAEVTLKLYEYLRAEFYPVAITLQAYLIRTKKDLEKIINNGGVVRLVKGAFAENKEIAYVKSDEIDNNFIKLSEMMLSEEARKKGFYPIFATHNEKLISKIIEVARSNNWEKGEYEFEMLY